MQGKKQGLRVLLARLPLKVSPDGRRPIALVTTSALAQQPRAHCEKLAGNHRTDPASRYLQNITHPILLGKLAGYDVIERPNHVDKYSTNESSFPRDVCPVKPPSVNRLTRRRPRGASITLSTEGLKIFWGYLLIDPV